MLLRPSLRPAPDEGLIGTPEAADGPQKRNRRKLVRRVVIVAAIVFASIVLVVGIGVAVIMLMARESASPFRFGQALEQYKALQRRDTKDPSSLAAPGVYTYTTSGSESASAPGLPSSSYSYPHTTTMTVYSSGCGQDWRWQPLDSRYEDLFVCRAPDGALMLRSRSDAEAFYGVTDTRTFACQAGSTWMPARSLKGQTFSGTCTNGGNKNSGGMSIAYTGKVAGEGLVDVGGASVKAVHVTLDESFTGDTEGTGSASIWIDSSTGFLLKESRNETSKSKSVVGWVPSSESFTIALDSLSPTR